MAETATTTPSHQEEEAFGKAYDGRLMRRLLTYLRPYKWQAGISLIAIFLKAGFDILGPYLVMVAANLYFARSRDWSPPAWARHLSADPIAGVSQIAAIYMASLLLSLGLEFLQTYLMQWTGQNIMFDMRRQIFRHLQQLHIGFFDRNPVGRLVTRVTSDVDALNEMFTAGVLAIFEDVFVLIGIVAFMLWMKWWLALLAFSVLPFIMLATHFFRVHVRESYRRIRTAIARINAHTQEHVSGMSVVQLFNRERKAYESFEAVNRSHMVAFKDAILAYSLYYPAVEMHQLRRHRADHLAGRGGRNPRPRPASRTVRAIHRHHRRAHRVHAIRSALLPPHPRSEREIQHPAVRHGIERAHLQAARYPGRDRLSPAAAGRRQLRPRRIPQRLVHLPAPRCFRRSILPPSIDTLRATGVPPSVTAGGAPIEWVLRDVSFTIEPDETAAIVGHTGAGKTTLTSLMMRFYDVQHGSVLIDGVDVREHDLSQLRRRFGVVLQDPFLFTGTIAENIRLGSSWITDQQMRHAADEVNVSDFIESSAGHL